MSVNEGQKRLAGRVTCTSVIFRQSVANLVPVAAPIWPVCDTLAKVGLGPTTSLLVTKKFVLII